MSCSERFSSSLPLIDSLTDLTIVPHPSPFSIRSRHRWKRKGYLIDSAITEGKNVSRRRNGNNDRMSGKMNEERWRREGVLSTEKTVYSHDQLFDWTYMRGTKQWRGDAGMWPGNGWRDGDFKKRKMGGWGMGDLNEGIKGLLYQ